MGKIGIFLNLLRAAAAAACFLVTGSASAGSCENCTLTNMKVLENGRVMFGTGLTNNSPPVCSSEDQHMIIDATTDLGKARLAVVQAAYLAGSRVYIYGLNSCIGGVEALNYIRVED